MSTTTKYLWITAGLVASVFFASCADDGGYEPVPLTLTNPSNFPEPVYDYTVNPPTEAGFELGKKLFYDGRLASDGVVSCAFCHLQAYAFTHHGHSLSHGVNNAVGTRNAPAIQNLAWQSDFMWDGAADHLDTQPLIPLLSDIEMNGNLTSIVAMLNNDGTYRRLFARAFPGENIDSEHLLKALGQFMVRLRSTDSRFDKYRRNEPGGNFTDSEMAGYATFQAKCASCHATDLQTDNSFRNNGLPVNPAFNDVGRYRVTENPADLHRFKVPSLRNVAVTAPYMHDGRFYTLEAVLEHYNSGVVNSPTLDPVLSGDNPGIRLSAEEKTNLIAFLGTLTDNTFLTNPLYSEY